MEHSATLLLVDDEVDNLQVLAGALKTHYRLRVATSGAEAVRLACTPPVPDLILLDIMMPEVDGYTVCAQLKADPRTCEIPVIFVTARTLPEDEMRGFAVGAVDYLTKPFVPPLLQARVSAHLALAAQLKRARHAKETSHRLVAKVTRERDALETHANELAREIAQRERVESALRASQARFARLTQRLGDRITFFTRSLEGQLLYVSEGFQALSQLLPEQAVGRYWDEVLDWSEEAHLRYLEANRQLCAGSQSIIEMELRYRHPDGRPRDLLITQYLVHDEDSGIDLIEGIAHDITEQRARETQLRILSRAVEQAAASIVVTDADGHIVYVNPHFSVMTGYSREEALGKNPRILKSGQHDENFYQNLWSKISRGETWRGELLNKKKDGSLFWESAAISGVINEHGVIDHYVAVKENITERKELERIKEDVERIVRHDLKNPLNAIIAFPELLLMDDNLTQSQREALNMIRESGLKMHDMITLSLDLFKMETKQYHYVPVTFDLLPLLAQLEKTAANKITRKRISLKIIRDGQEVTELAGAPLWVQADERLLFSLLSNLFVNAIEASPAGETVVIELQSGPPARLTLRNVGAVPAAMRAHFFEKYKTYGKQGGTGLGTYSAKLMADTMGFDLSMTTSDTDNCTALTLVLAPAAS